jgi:hypothetical protein
LPRPPDPTAPPPAVAPPAPLLALPPFPDELPPAPLLKVLDEQARPKMVTAAAMVCEARPRAMRDARSSVVAGKGAPVDRPGHDDIRRQDMICYCSGVSILFPFF